MYPNRTQNHFVFWCIHAVLFVNSSSQNSVILCIYLCTCICKHIWRCETQKNHAGIWNQWKSILNCHHMHLHTTSWNWWGIIEIMKSCMWFLTMGQLVLFDPLPTFLTREDDILAHSCHIRTKIYLSLIFDIIACIFRPSPHHRDYFY